VTAVSTSDPAVPPVEDQVEGAGHVAPASRPSRAPQRRRVVSPATLVRQAIGSSILILAVCALGFVVWLALFSRLHYDHAQDLAYDTLRYDLAQGTAPTGPTEVVNPNEANSPVALVPSGTPLALLSIPEIGLRAVVFQGTTGSVLENGPGHLRDTELPGQVGISVIMGRQAAYGGPFSKLASLAPGDAFTVVTGQTVAQFTVLDLRRGGDPSPPPPAEGQSRLILVTGDGAPFAPSGLLYVDANLTSKPQVAPPMVLSSSDLSPSENAMGTDPSAWLPIVFWGQLLLLATLGLSWLRSAWGRWQTWLIAVPILGYIVLSIADEVTRLLPNVM
jgi:sortase A